MPDIQLVLRPVEDEDLPIFFAFQQDQEAVQMAAFTAKNPADRAAFDFHWQKIRSDPTLVTRTIVWNGEIVGSIGKFEMFGMPQVTYWIGKQFWGKGIATCALRELLSQWTARPIYASAAADNAGSIRVLEKCGFVQMAIERGFANARGEEIDEIVFKLEI